jgi:periplasmic protein CpxP/Spy
MDDLRSRAVYRTVMARRSSKRASKPTGPNAIGVKMTGARGGSCSCSTRIAVDLNLSDAQKAQLKTALETARERLDEAREKNPNLTIADVLAKLIAERSTVRERVVQFFTPEQLAKWDAEVAKAKTFLSLAVNE